MAENENTDGAAAADERRINPRKIYVKDSSFEAPDAPSRTPAITGGNWSPETNIQFNGEHRDLGENNYETVLSVTVTVKNEGEVAYLCEIQQAGLFEIAGFNDAEMAGILGVFCPNTLFPFVREAIASMVSHGGFPPLLLAPINFEAIFAENVRKARQQQAEGATADAG